MASYAIFFEVVVLNLVVAGNEGQKQNGGSRQEATAEESQQQFTFFEPP